MNILKKMLSVLTTQIKNNDVIFPTNDLPEKILHVDLSKTGWNINENTDADLRSTVKPKRKRRKISVGTD